MCVCVFFLIACSFDVFGLLGDFSSLSSPSGPPHSDLMTGKQVKTFTIGISGSLSSLSVFAACSAKKVGLPARPPAADSAAFAKVMQVFVD